VERVGDVADGETGTLIRFTPDAEIFETTAFDFETLESRLRELAFLNSGVTIALRDERDAEGGETTFHYEGGIRAFVRYLNESRTPLHDDVIFLTGEESDVQVEIAMQATDDLQSSTHAFANNINTREGGTHLTGFKTALTRTVNDYANGRGLLAELDGENLTGEDIREGLTAVVSIKHPDPQFEGQTKTKLGNSDVRGIVESIVHEGLGTYFEEGGGGREGTKGRAEGRGADAPEERPGVGVAAREARGLPESGSGRRGAVHRGGRQRRRVLHWRHRSRAG